MAGGNSHQRAVERAAKSRIEKQVSETVAKLLDGKKSPSAQPPAKPEKSVLRKFFDWEGVSFVTLSLAGIAFLTIPHGYIISRICFVSAAIVLVIKLALGIETTLYPKCLIAVLASIVAGVVVNKVNNWVTSLEIDEISKVERSARTTIVKSNEPERAGEKPRPRPSTAQLQEIAELNRFLVGNDESTLRATFGFPAMLQINTQMEKERAIHYDQTGQAVINLEGFLAEGCQLLLSNTEGDVRRYGGAFGV